MMQVKKFSIQIRLLIPGADDQALYCRRGHIELCHKCVLIEQKNHERYEFQAVCQNLNEHEIDTPRFWECSCVFSGFAVLLLYNIDERFNY